MQATGASLADVRQRLAAARARDTPFASGRVLGSMCTAPHPIAIEAYQTFLETNLGDPHLCPGAAELEREALAMLGTLLHAPPQARGVFLTGGSEANFTALLMAQRRRPGRDIVLPESAHFSFDKVCHFLGLRPRTAHTSLDGRVDITEIQELIGPHTSAVVAIAGSTELGVVDPIPDIAALCLDLGVPLHVDAAWGGFVIPFAKRLGHDLPDFDLGVDGVTSLTIDPHKMGLAPIPAGVLFARDGADFSPLALPSPYVSIERQPSLQGTRPGAAAAATWAVMTHLGMAGYQEVVACCLATTARLARGLKGAGYALAREPELNLVSFRVDDPVAARAALREAGWLVSLAPATRGLKVVVMPHVSAEAVDAFLAVLPEIVRPALNEVPT